MASTIKTLIQRFARLKGLTPPNTIQTNTDVQAMQLLEIANLLPIDLSTRRAWQATRVEASFTSTAAENQGNIYTLCPFGYMGLASDTMYDRSTTLPIAGAMDGKSWQYAKATALTGPLYRFRIRGDQLLFNPALPAGKSVFFEYLSDWFVRPAGGSPPQQYFSLDSDYLALNDSILTTWLTWRWKMEKGLDYAEDFRLYEAAVASLSLRENTPQIADSTMGSCQQPISGIVVPLGSWPL